ncbi:hypothetical protein Q7C36_021167 [Tachysurus vachellii]|uniref:Uncharacterized protein n=1 Tax=Tachysurus vachellii TaxID=175792 RepID=A0AA88IUT8_TACVA|nr:hypothetical protein Q7C36_021167 [Tachysurus vachellii]
MSRDRFNRSEAEMAGHEPSLFKRSGLVATWVAMEVTKTLQQREDFVRVRPKPTLIDETGGGLPPSFNGSDRDRICR